MRVLSSLFILILSSFFSISAQSISSLGTGSIVELECERSSVTNTFVAVSMERNKELGIQQVVIHRSVDYGATWSFIDSIGPKPSDFTIADPVIATDSNGFFYLVLMRVLTIDPYNIHLEFYRSEDDGLTWDLVNRPYDQDLGADYPQIISRGDGELYLVYSLYTISTGVFDSTVQFRKSTDGGSTWTDPQVFGSINANGVATIGPDLSFGYNGSINVAYGGYNDKVYSLISEDNGDTWSDISVSTTIDNTPNNIVKPVSNKNYENWGIISHEPHRYLTPISFHRFKNNQWIESFIDLGAYGQGFMDDSGIIHVVYNHIDNQEFQIKYVYSIDGGVNFNEAIVLYSSPFQKGHEGEYQSLLMDDDGTFYLTFCDWADASKAKFLIFNPDVTSTENVEVIDFKIYPNPTADFLNIHLQKDVVVKEMNLLDVDGKVLKTVKVNPAENLYLMDVTNLSSGNYVILLKDDNRIFVKLFNKI